jgi:hypothetical protein
MPEMISLSKQMQMSENESNDVQNTIKGIIETNDGTTYYDIIERVLIHRMRWSGSQNFYAGFIIARALTTHELTIASRTTRVKCHTAT